MADLVTVDRSTWERQRDETDRLRAQLDAALERLRGLDTASAVLRKRVADLEAAAVHHEPDRLAKASALAELAIIRGRVRDLARTLEGYTKHANNVPAGRLRGIVGKLRALL